MGLHTNRSLSGSLALCLLCMMGGALRAEDTAVSDAFRAAWNFETPNGLRALPPRLTGESGSTAATAGVDTWAADLWVKITTPTANQYIDAVPSVTVKWTDSHNASSPGRDGAITIYAAPAWQETPTPIRVAGPFLESNATNQATFTVEDLTPGVYYLWANIEFENEVYYHHPLDRGFLVPMAGDVPVVEIIEPARSTTVDDYLTIRWVDYNAGEDAVIDLYYTGDPDSSVISADGTFNSEGTGLTAIALQMSVEDETDFVQWDTSLVPSGAYYLVIAARDSRYIAGESGSSGTYPIWAYLYRDRTIYVDHRGYGVDDVTPKVSITSPADEAVVTSPSVTVKGTAYSNEDINFVWVTWGPGVTTAAGSGLRVQASADTDGFATWHAAITLTGDGATTIRAYGVDSGGTKTRFIPSVSITYEETDGEAGATGDSDGGDAGDTGDTADGGGGDGGTETMPGELSISLNQEVYRPLDYLQVAVSITDDYLSKSQYRDVYLVLLPPDRSTFYSLTEFNRMGPAGLLYPAGSMLYGDGFVDGDAIRARLPEFGMPGGFYTWYLVLVPQGQLPYGDKSNWVHFTSATMRYGEEP